MAVRAKFTVSEITQFHWGAGQRIKLSPIYDPSIPEDRRFFDATPTGTIEMYVNNPGAIEQLKMGTTFYVDFTPVPAEQAAA